MSVRRITLSQLLLCCLSAAFFLFLAANDALAQASGGAGSFSCTGGMAQGSLYSPGFACPTTLQFDNIFSFLVCNIEELSSNLLGQMFCGMTEAMKPAVSAFLTFAVVMYGLGFTIGVIPATARDLQMFMIRIACVWVFATQTDFILGLGYNFFINGVRDGVDIVLAGLDTTGKASTGYGVYHQLDTFLGTMVSYATAYVDGTGGSDGGKNALFAVLVIMAIAFPPIFFLAIGIIIKMALTFFRAVFGYVYALLGIAFMMILAPFFLCFFVFQRTRSLFEKWVGYMVSYALQIIILFAFLSFILSLLDSPGVTNLLGSIPKIVVKNDEVIEGSAFRAPWEYCTICDFQVLNSVTHLPVAEIDYDSYIGQAELVCNPNGKKFSVLNSVSPDQKQQNALLKFAGGGFISLLVLAFVMETLLTYAASLAQLLAGGFGGAYYATQLGGGASMRSAPTAMMPGDALITDFEQGLAHGTARSGNTVGAMTHGMKDAMRGMVRGETSTGEILRDKAGNQLGLKNRFLDWLVDPDHIGR